MECFVTCWDGSVLVLPDLLSWQFTYTSGTPCDAFSVECLWSETLELSLSNGVTFSATEDGETVFCGVVDEYTCQWDGNGGVLEVHGRGMGARLLDNEALGAEYVVATAAELFRDHVTPYGITIVEHESLSAVSEFSISNGSSEWQVLYEFAHYYGGVMPRFDCSGRLIIGDDPDSVTRTLNESSGITAISYTDKRYGVISEVWVRDSTSQNIQYVVDEDFVAQGGCARRILTMPQKTSYQARRHSGAYQIACAKEERIRLEVTLGQVFGAWPQDLVEIALEKPYIHGTYRVLEVETGVDATGNFSKITLGEAE